MASNDVEKRCNNSKTFYDPVSKIWSGEKQENKYSKDCSLGEVILRNLLKNPEEITQICCNSGREYTKGEIADLSFCVARKLKKLGLEQCDVIGFCGANTDFVAPLVFGALFNGFVVSTLDPSFGKDGIKHIFSITKPKLMFCDGSSFENVKAALNEINLQTEIYTMTDDIAGVPDIREFLKSDSNKIDRNYLECLAPLKEGSLQTAFILCSSGTTGPPKGVKVSHLSLLQSTFLDYFQPKDRLLCFSSLYWGSGVLCLIVGTLKDSTRLIYNNAFQEDIFFDVVETYKASIIIAPPSQLALLVASQAIYKRDLSSLNFVLTGGSSVAPSLVSKFQPFIPNGVIIVSYAMTEVPGTGIAVGLANENGSVGKICKNFELRIIDNNGSNLGPNEKGEILVRKSIPFTGYYMNPKATAEAYDKDGWIHSGDIGYVNDFDQLFVVDRKKEILKYNNFHFSPTEIENEIMKIPDVAEVCVCGIPDEISGFLPAAMIVLKTGSQMTENDILNYVAERLEHFKQLRGGVFFTKEIPKTPSGKNLRGTVSEMCEKLRNSKNNKI